MTFEAYYGTEAYKRLLLAQTTLEKEAGRLQKREKNGKDDLQPIVYYCSRIKKPESMMKKREEKGLTGPVDISGGDIFDAVGLRIVCSFASDAITVVECLEKSDTFTVLKKKDYFSYPKPNGYRSIHLCIRMKENNVLAEIQVRTIAMDCWATLEHQLKYKKNIENEALIMRELKRCADEIASADLSMQTLREIMKG